STSERSSGTARPLTMRTARMMDSLSLPVGLLQVCGCGEVPGDRRRRGDGGGDEVGAATATLTSLEVAVRRRRAPFARDELVRIHGEAHRAPRLAPVEPRGAEDLVKTLGLGLRLDRVRTGHDERADAAGDVAAVGHGRGHAQILDATVGARADEDGVDRDVTH